MIVLELLLNLWESGIAKIALNKSRNNPKNDDSGDT